MRSTIFLVCLAMIVPFISSCTNQPSQSADAVVAVVNGSAITEDDLALFMNGGHSIREPEDARLRMIDELINQELLYQQGLKLGMDKDPRYRNQIRIMEMRIREYKRAEMARQVASIKIAAAVSITSEDARRYYAQNESMITTDLRLSILRFPSEDQARAAHESITAGAPFDDVAAQVLPAGSGQDGDTGFLHWNQIPVEWADSFFNLSRGEVSRVLHSPRLGYCVARLTDRRKNPDATFEAMSASITNRLQDIRIQEAYDRYIAQLRKEAHIIKHAERRNAS